MDLKMCQSKKRSQPEIFKLEATKKYKIDESLKENIFPISRKLSNRNCAQDFPASLQNLGKATPKKGLQCKEDPITPNTNFKLLTSLAASLDYANCGTPKSRKIEESPIVENDVSNMIEIDLPSGLKPSRKEKSLGLVCSKFLNIFPLHPEPDAHIIVSLDEASFKLKVERRRLYDIVNVFESIDMLAKVAKNRYVWYGKNNLLKALQRIKAIASEESIHKKLQYVLKSEEWLLSPRHTCILDEVQDFNRSLDSEDPTIKELLVPTSPFPEVRKEKSLAVMSQKFLMIFLVSPSKVISLGVAAKVLNGFQKNDKGAQIKTQIRRLYDIANVLSSIGLIQKEMTLAASGKKPAFKYIGPNLEELEGLHTGKENIQTIRCKYSPNKVKPRSLVRHSSFQEICAVAELEHQKLCLNEPPKSAPPFEKNMSAVTINNTTFTNWKPHPNSCKENEVNNKENQNFKGLNQSNVLCHLHPNHERSKTIVKPKPVTTLQLQQKVINVPKISNNGPFYILNNAGCVPNTSTSAGTFLLLNTCMPITKQKEESKSPDKKVATSQTVKLSPIQRDAILKSLNISLSAGQIAAIQLEGTTQSSNSFTNSQHNMLKIIDKNNKLSSTEIEHVNFGRSVQNDGHNDLESNGSSVCSTRNSTPRYGSPLSIPSGYATPILSASTDITSFPTNSEVDYFLRKLENRSVTPNAIRKIEFPNIINKPASPELVHHDKVNPCLQNKGMQILSHITDSCSSESLNAEVSNIMKESRLGEASPATRNKSFLIDEKTILSPIKTSHAVTKVLTPSPLMTPPYIVPDTIFLFNTPLNFQNNGIANIRKPLSFKVKGNNACDKSAPVTHI